MAAQDRADVLQHRAGLHPDVQRRRAHLVDRSAGDGVVRAPTAGPGHIDQVSGHAGVREPAPRRDQRVGRRRLGHRVLLVVGHPRRSRSSSSTPPNPGAGSRSAGCRRSSARSARCRSKVHRVLAAFAALDLRLRHRERSTMVLTTLRTTGSCTRSSWSPRASRQLAVTGRTPLKTRHLALNPDVSCAY